MAQKALVVVESPAKARTIKKYLGKDFDVKASVGHVKDLPKGDIGVDVDDGFKPKYETILGKGKVLQEIRAAAKTADMVYLAPDPDREGEAIAWHIASELQLPDEKIKRVLFNEITASAIRKALDSPLTLNQNRFNSQQARRILDRLVGYRISPLLWQKVRRGLSAGRVQSVAVRIIVEREREVIAFVPEEYWRIEGIFDSGEKPEFKGKLHQLNGERVEPKNADDANGILDTIKNGPFSVKEVQERESKKSPGAPFTTSRLQQEASKAFRFTAKRTMSIAQRLYEGVELGSEGALGLITYMRTDSTRISGDAINGVRSFIQETFGPEYLPAKPNVYKTKGRAQDAHEAIRPTSLAHPPEKVASFLKPEELKLYRLIWNRFVACQMTPARYAQTRVDIAAPGGYTLRSTGSVLIFAGHQAVFRAAKGIDETEESDATLPKLVAGQELKALNIEATQHFTKPPARFTEATLVKELEEQGIGRPSTYASIISTIQDKTYAEKKDSRFHPSELGLVVTDLLVESFPQLFDVGFTARMEDRLDAVEDGRENWRDLLGTFWTDFSATLKTAESEMRDVKREEKPTDLDCPRCSETRLVIKFGKNGSFLACKQYPECTFTSEYDRQDDGSVKIREEERVGSDCSACDDGELIYKAGRFGRFVGCTNYPTCKHTEPVKTGVGCAQCDSGAIIEKQSRRGKIFYACDQYPKCDYAQWDQPIPVACPSCGHPHVDRKVRGRDERRVLLICPSCKAEMTEAELGLGAAATP